MAPITTLQVFKNILPHICDRETSQDPDGWTPQNPLWAHCAKVSVLAHALFGGDIIVSVIIAPRKFKSVRHYRNIFPDGIVEDFTSDQFGNAPLKFQNERRITNSVLHLRIENSRRYKLLAFRMAKAVVARLSIQPEKTDEIHPRVDRTSCIELRLLRKLVERYGEITGGS